MRMRRVFVRNFRKLVQPVSINIAGDGITIIVGDNEEGKSTVLHAIRAAFCQRYNAGGKIAANLQPYNSAVGPEVKIEFEISDKTFVLHKVFGQKPLAELKTPDGQYQGPEAEEKLAKLCGLPTKDKAKASGDPASPTICGLLWVPQATAIAGLEMGEESRQTIQTALETEIGDIFGGNDGRALLRRITARYLEWFTEGRGSPRGVYKAASEAVSKANDGFEECKHVFDEYVGKLDELDIKRDRVERYVRENALGQAQDALKYAQAEVQKLDRLKGELQNYEQRERTEHLQYLVLEDNRQKRLRLISDICSVEKSLAEISASEIALKEAAERLNAEYRQAEESDKSAESMLKESEEALRNAETVLEILRTLRDRDEARQRLNSARNAQDAANKALQEIESIIVTHKLVTTLRELERTAALEEMRLSAAVTAVSLAPSENKRAYHDQKHIEIGKSLVLTAKTTLHLEDWGDITITPGGEDLERREEAVAQAQTSFHTALENAGVTSLSEAEELATQRAGHEGVYDLLNKEVQIHAPAGIDVLTKETDLLDSKVSQLEVASKHLLEPVLSIDEAMQMILLARQNKDSATTVKESSAVAVKHAGSVVQKVAADLQELAGKRLILVSQRDSLSKQIEVERTQKGDEALEADIESLRQITMEAHENTELAKKSIEELDSEVLAQRLADCVAHHEQVSGEITQLTQDIRELSGELKAYGRDGLYERLHAAKDAKEMFGGQYHRLHQEAQALKLLFETLRESEQQVKQQVLAPIMMRLEPYLELVFPGAKLHFDRETFELSHIERSQLLECYQDLSVGTREQLSILTRLAIAEMLVDSGSSAVVILDDALVYSDSKRFGCMELALRKAAEKVQLIVLTCRQEDYEDLGAQTIKLADCYDETGDTVAAQLQRSS